MIELLVWKAPHSRGFFMMHASCQPGITHQHDIPLLSTAVGKHYHSNGFARGSDMKEIYIPFVSDRSPGLDALHDATRAGKARRETWLAAVRELRGPAQWQQWAEFWLLAYGLALLLAGVVFFFAWNWADMHRFEKFGLIQLGIVGSVLVAWRSGWRGVAGQSLLIVATVLVGVLMAVFGQVYQTGADAWQLFVSWSFLVLPWVIIANSAALWVLWLVIAETALATYFDLHGDSWKFCMTLGAVLPAALLALRDFRRLQGSNWLGTAWLRMALLVMSLGLASIPAGGAIFIGSVPVGWILPWAVLAVAVFVTYRYVFQDILALTLVVFNAAFMLLAVIGRGLFEIADDAGIFWLMALSIVGVVAGAYKWLRVLAAEIQAAASTEGGKHEH